MNNPAQINVIVPCAPDAHPVTKQVLASEGIVAQYIGVGHSPYGYHHLMRDIWSQRKQVIIVEHDIVPWPGAIAELAACPCAWGSYSYKIHGGIGIFHGLGCTKLTPELMDATSDLWSDEVWHQDHWSKIDQVLFFAARERGYEPHHHRPPVIHLSDKHNTSENLRASRPSTGGPTPKKSMPAL